MPWKENLAEFDSGFLSTKGDMDARIRSTKFDSRYIYENFSGEPVLSASTPDTGAAVGATTERLVKARVSSFHISPCGTTQTLLAPFKSTTVGWDVTHDLTDNDEIEISAAGCLATDCPLAFTVGTDTAFFFRVKATIADASGAECFQIGFRKQAAFAQAGDANPPVLSDYTDYAAIGLRGTANPNTIKIATNLNSGGETLTDTTMTWADAAQKTLVVKVSAAGVVTYEVNGAAPTATAAFTMDTGDIMIPFIKLVHGSDVANGVVLNEVECGLQPSSRVTLV